MNLIFFLNVFTSPKKNTLHLPDSYTQTDGLVLIKISLCRFHCGLYLTRLYLHRLCEETQTTSHSKYYCKVN